MVENQELNKQVAQRLKEVTKYLSTKRIAMSDKELADLVGINASTMSLILNGRTRATEKFVLKLCNLSKNLNFEWIMTGNGSMLKGENESSNDLIAQEPSENLTVALQTIDKLVSIIAEKDRQIGKLIDMMSAEKNTSDATRGVSSAAANE